MVESCSGCRDAQESHSSRLEQKKKQKAAKEAMSEEMDAALRQKAAESAARAAAAAATAERERSSIVTPGLRTPGTGLQRRKHTFGL